MSRFPDPLPWSRSFPAEPGQVGEARRFVAGILGKCPAAPDAVLCLSEMLNNAVTHSASKYGGKVEVHVGHDAGEVRLEVADQGGRWQGEPGADGERGRGLLIIGALARDWGVSSGDGGRVAWCALGCEDSGHAGE
jgi:anti-sigma regulatory factor (Ser/Thr protein kinase)